MQTVYILIAGCFIAAAIFAWFMASLLDILNAPLTGWGIALQKTLRVEQRDEKDAWLFTLLISLVRTPLIVIAGIAFFFYLLGLFSSSADIASLSQVALSTFWIIFIMREVSIVIGSVLLGPTMRDIMHSLRS